MLKSLFKDSVTTWIHPPWICHTARSQKIFVIVIFNFFSFFIKLSAFSWYFWERVSQWSWPKTHNLLPQSSTFGSASVNHHTGYNPKFQSSIWLNVCWVFLWICVKKKNSFAILECELKISQFPSHIVPKLNNLLLLLYMHLIFVNLMYRGPSEKPRWLKERIFLWYIII
jgi:hypothetical protein